MPLREPGGKAARAAPIFEESCGLAGRNAVSPGGGSAMVGDMMESILHPPLRMGLGVGGRE